MRKAVLTTMYMFMWFDLLVWLGALVFGPQVGMRFRDLIIVLHSLAFVAVLWAVSIPAYDSAVWSTFVCLISLHGAIAALGITILISVYVGVFKACLGAYLEAVLSSVVAVASQMLAYGVMMWGIHRHRGRAA